MSSNEPDEKSDDTTNEDDVAYCVNAMRIGQYLGYQVSLMRKGLKTYEEVKDYMRKEHGAVFDEDKKKPDSNNS